MSTESKSIRFFFDYISPYSYLAWLQLHALAERHHREVEPVPIFFPGLIAAHGQKSPVDIPAKYLYVMKDVIRRSHLRGVPFSLPAIHPFNSLLALRVSSVPMPATSLRALIGALFGATWAGGSGISRPEDIVSAAATVGLDGARLIADAETPEGKLRVRRSTDAAVARGVFGVPTLDVDDELFWGEDSLSHVDCYLRGEDPVDAKAFARWNQTRTGA